MQWWKLPSGKRGDRTLSGRTNLPGGMKTQEKRPPTTDSHTLDFKTWRDKPDDIYVQLGK